MSGPDDITPGFDPKGTPVEKPVNEVSTDKASKNLAAQDRSTENVKGAVLMIFGMAAFVGNVTLMKLVSFELSLFQAIFLRGCFAAVVLGGLAFYRRELFIKVSSTDAKVLSIRIVGEIGASLCYFMALFNMPIANVTAILQALPLVITLGAAIFFGETIGWRRYGGIVLGFVGILIIVQPGTDGFSVYSLWALASMFSVAIRDLATRRFSSGLPSLFVAFATMVCVTLVAGLLTPTMEWKPVSLNTVGMLAGAAIFIMVVHITLIQAMRVGEVAFVTPFRYTVMIWAIALGYFIFDETPENTTLIGCSLLILTGIYSFWRERKVVKENLDDVDVIPIK
ncbi:DMT family transporter [Kiloniella antarctica]|uniref:DMT family transporter n=1 Tax=Kiloniella antarctica TaxID=1550907 RepID=A0ABW5BIF0_9PROT